MENKETQIDENLVDYLAQLSLLHFDDNEKKELVEDLHKIKNFFEKLQSINTDNVEPLEHLNTSFYSLREDKIFPFEDKEKLVQLSNQSINNYYTIPKVIKNKKHE